MESMSLSVVVAVVGAFSGVVATFAIMKSKVSSQSETNAKQDETNKKLYGKIEALNKFRNEKEPLLNHLSKSEDEQDSAIKEIGQSVATLKEKIQQAPSMKEVRQEFVSKEIFLAMERRIDEKLSGLEDRFKDVSGRFNSVDQGLEKVLEKISENKK